MSTVARFNNFYLPPSEGKDYVDALAQALLNSPEWIQDDIDSLEAEIADLFQTIVDKRCELAALREKLAGLAVRS